MVSLFAPSLRAAVRHSADVVYFTNDSVSSVVRWMTLRRRVGDIMLKPTSNQNHVLLPQIRIMYLFQIYSWRQLQSDLCTRNLIPEVLLPPHSRMGSFFGDVT